MNLLFSDRAWEDYLYWQETDRQKIKRIHQLLKEIARASSIGDRRNEIPPHSTCTR